MHLLAIQASTVTEKTMLAQFFAVIRSDEHESIFPQAPAIQFDHQLADLRVEVARARYAVQYSPGNNKSGARQAGKIKSEMLLRSRFFSRPDQ